MALVLLADVAYADDVPDASKNWEQWTACSTDEECVAIHDECGGWTAVNGQFQQQGEAYQDELGATAKCTDMKMEPEPKVLCLDQVCSVKPTNAQMGIQ